jgi:uncharacterized protein YndB with AHSA1/START domain
MKTIRQRHLIHASPEEVFTALTNPLTIELWSGYPAVMEATEGFEFSLFDGDIAGKNLKLVENRQVVQEWFFGDNSPEASIVTIDLTKHREGTRVMLEHTNVPDEEATEFEEGWREYFWGAIKAFFA